MPWSRSLASPAMLFVVLLGAPASHAETVSCPEGYRPSPTHPFYGNPTIEVTPSGNSVLALRNLEVHAYGRVEIFDVDISGGGTGTFDGPGTVFNNWFWAHQLNIQMSLALTCADAEFFRAPPRGNIRKVNIMFLEDPGSYDSWPDYGDHGPRPEIAVPFPEDLEEPIPGDAFLNALFFDASGIVFDVYYRSDLLNEDRGRFSQKPPPGDRLWWSVAVVTRVSGPVIPIPATLPLFLSALAGLGFARWRRNRLTA